MDRFFHGVPGGQDGQQHPQQQESENDHSENPFINLFRSVTGQRGMDAAADLAASATAAAGQFGNVVRDQFQQHAQSMHMNIPHHQEPPGGPPPASSAALRQLPMISVTPEDLVDETNRECCICFEEHHIHDKVVRLPCAHIFHRQCITDWLNLHCTCPTCRYELPTNDGNYEIGRRQRMQSRKPRYARYELERMTIRELKQLFPRRVSSSIFSDKSDLIEYLIANEIVDLISTPPPVEFPSLAFLRAMGVSKLKKTMNETGVYFDMKDVVEKEDMVQIFFNSGRICLAQEELDDDNGPDTTYGHAPCERERNFSMGSTMASALEQDDAIDETKASAADNSELTQSNERITSVKNEIIVETVEEDDDEDEEEQFADQNYANRERSWKSDTVLEEANEQKYGDTTTPTESASHASSNDRTGDLFVPNAQEGLAASSFSNPQNGATMVGPAGENNNHGSDAVDIEADIPEDFVFVNSGNTDEDQVASQRNKQQTFDSDVEMEDAEELDDSQDESQRKRQRCDEGRGEDTGTDDELDRFQKLSVSELRRMAKDQGVDLTNCIERGEIIERLSSTGSSSVASNDESRVETLDEAGITVETLQNWTVSHLRACAQAVNVDLSHCSGQDAMIQALVDAASGHPRVARYLTALSPLMNMSISQLRALAREWQIPTHDCLEKGDIIMRLASSAANRSSG